jgi:hypothetical protein
VTTPGDAVGPSAKSAVAAAPTPETDADLQAAEQAPGAGQADVRDASAVAGPSGSDPAQPSDGTGTARPADSDDDTGPVATDETTGRKSRKPSGESRPSRARPTTAADPAASAEPGKPAEADKAAEPANLDGPDTADEPDKADTPEPETAPIGDAEPVTASIDDAEPVRDTEPTLVDGLAPADKPAVDAGTVPEDETAATEAAGAEPTAAEPTATEPTATTTTAAEPTATTTTATTTTATTTTATTTTATATTASEPGAALAPEVIAPVPGPVRDLAVALDRLRAAIGGTAYPLVMPSADEARQVGTALVAQLDDYLLPRLARLDAPLLVVVGGSTGAGKSTLVNSLVRKPISASGVLRPTTRSPVLVCHPTDTAWFRKGDLLPGLTRTTEPGNDPKTLQLVAIDAIGPGLAFLDAPDIDSIVDANRALASQLLAAADLWLFVTTAARYADAVPWELLRTARFRGTVIALVLDRVPAEAAGDISAHLAEMLAANELGAAPLFVLPETVLDDQGLLPEDEAAPLRDWFAQLASDSSARSAVVRQTLDGALTALVPAVDGLAAAADEQAVAAKALDERVRAAYRNSRRTVEQGLQDGRLLRGEVLARWQEFIGTGEFLRSLESRVGRVRDRIVAAVTGRPAPGRNLQVALESQLVTLLRGVAADAAEQAYTGWQAHPAGAALLDPSLGRASDDLPARAERLVRDWQRNVLEIVRTEAADKRFVARSAAYAVNATGLAVMIAVFTSTAFIPTGAELAVGAGTTVAAQKVLEAIFGDQAIRALAAKAREDLLSRVTALLDAEAARYAARTEAVGLDVEPGAELRSAAAGVEKAREALALTAHVDLRLVDPA